MRGTYRITLALIIIGAINWGLIALFNFDLVATLFGGQNSILTRIVYGLVGISGLLCIGLLFKSWDEEEEVVHRDATARNLNYQTEFAEEENFDKYKKNDSDENKDIH